MQFYHNQGFKTLLCEISQIEGFRALRFAPSNRMIFYYTLLICMCTCAAYNMSNVGPEPTPSWADVVPHVHRMSRAELSQFPDSSEGAEGFSFTTIICQGDRYLPWLQRRFENVQNAVQTGRLLGR